MKIYPLIAMCLSVLFTAPQISAEQTNNHQATPVETSFSMLIRINSASEQELQTLKGVGSSKAQAIIQYRNANGEFNSVDDLLKVRGVGQAILNDNQGLLSL